MSINDVQSELLDIKNRIMDYWGENVSDLNLLSITDKPYDMFTLSMRLYEKYDVLVDYDRSSLGFRVKMNADYIILSKLSRYPIYRGFDSYLTANNIMHNFRALDDVVRLL